MNVNTRFNKLAKSVKQALFYSVVATTALSLPVLAEEADDGADGESQKIIITGSRIKRANLESASPVTTVSGEDFKLRGITRVEDLLLDLPQVFPGQVSGNANGATGTATIDLRFLGPQRTLTLMNGRRLPLGSPLDGGDGADINQIPAALVERVELLTGGASSTY